jgi:hypothetical protein
LTRWHIHNYSVTRCYRVNDIMPIISLCKRLGAGQLFTDFSLRQFSVTIPSQSNTFFTDFSLRQFSVSYSLFLLQTLSNFWGSWYTPNLGISGARLFPNHLFYRFQLKAVFGNLLTNFPIANLPISAQGCFR